MATIRNHDGQIIGIWSNDLPMTEHAASAYQLIDPERVSSATGILKSYERKKQAIKQDLELSEAGKLKRIAEAASVTLANLRSPAKKLIEMESEYGETVKAATADAVPPASVIDAMYDIEIAKQARQEDKIPTLLERGTPRERLALVRTPGEISGLKSEVIERLRGSMVSPDLAYQFEAQTASMRAARQTIQTAIKQISPDATDMSPAQKRALIGEGFDV